jgi:hypothetical protein
MMILLRMSMMEQLHASNWQLAGAWGGCVCEVGNGAVKCVKCCSTQAGWFDETAAAALAAASSFPSNVLQRSVAERLTSALVHT